MMQIGPITPEILERTILPVMARLRTKSSAGPGALIRAAVSRTCPTLPERPTFGRQGE